MLFFFLFFLLVLLAQKIDNDDVTVVVVNEISLDDIFELVKKILRKRSSLSLALPEKRWKKLTQFIMTGLEQLGLQ